MKRSLVPMVLLLTILTAIPAAHATDSIFNQTNSGFEDLGSAAYGTAVQVSETTFSVALLEALNFLLTFLAIVFFALLMYSGYLWMTARGHEEQVEKSKKITREVIIGLLLIITARIITEFILITFSGAVTPQ